MDRLQFCVFHIEKFSNNNSKGGLVKLGLHIDRKRVSKNVNPEKSGFNEIVGPKGLRLLDVLGNKIDRSKSSLLEEHVPLNDKNLEEAVRDRINEGHTVKDQVRHDAVRALLILLSGSNERMLEIQADKELFKEWKEANYKFICEIFGKENIVRFTLHVDEKTPHIHCVVVPISPKGRLSARHYVNGREKLERLQDKYAAAMAPFKLLRGVPSELTHRAHVSTRDYYKDVQALSRELEELTASIKMANVFKLDDIKRNIHEKVLMLNICLREEQERARHAMIANKNLMEAKESAVYERRLVYHAYGALDSIKRDIPLIPFLTERLGWVKDEDRSTQLDIVLSHPKHGAIVVPSRPKEGSGYWVYRTLQGGREDTLVGLLLAEDWGWKEIRALSLEGIQNRKYEVDSAIQTKQAQENLDRIVAARVSSILRHMGIDRESYEGLTGLKISKDEAVFSLHKDFDSRGKYRLCSTLSYCINSSGVPLKYLQEGLPTGIAVVSSGVSLQKADRIVITPSPMEALFHRQLELKGLEGKVEWREVIKTSFPRAVREGNTSQEYTVYVSTCGGITRETKKDLEEIFKLAKSHGKHVVVGMSRDTIGSLMSMELVGMLRKSGCSYHIEKPNKKDWNETLRELPRLISKQEEEEGLRKAAMKEWEGFKEGVYEASLLVNLGISKDTLKAFQETVKVNDKAVLVSLHAPLQEGIVNTWYLNMDKEGGLQVATSSSLFPPVTILKGNIRGAKELVLVSSPLDALVHYEEKIKKRHSNSLNKICYLYISDRVGKDLERSLESSVKLLPQMEEIKVTLATSKETTKVIAPLIDQYRTTYSPMRATIVRSGLASYGMAKKLVDLAAILASSAVRMKTPSSYDEDEEEAEKRKRKKVRGMGYRL
jgi:hypothetical protein